MNLAVCLLDHFQWISQHFLQSNQNKTEQQKSGSCSIFDHLVIFHVFQH